MRTWRRSWFRLPRWWVDVPVTAVLVFAGYEVLPLVWGEHLDTHPGGQALMAVGVAVGLQRGDRRQHAPWRELESSSPATDAELAAAEGVVRDGRPPTGERVLREAVRIADLRWEQLGGSRWRHSAIAAALSAGLLVAGVLASPWWLVLAAVCSVQAAWRCTTTRRLAQRRRDLRAMLTSTSAVAC